MLVGVTRTFYRCLTWGSDLEQYVNGKISYIPRLHKQTYRIHGIKQSKHRIFT